MRKQQPVLKDHADAATLRRQRMKRLAVEHDGRLARPGQPRHGGHDAGLASARRAEQRHHTGRRRFEGNIEGEIAARPSGPNGERHPRRPSRAEMPIRARQKLGEAQSCHRQDDGEQGQPCSLRLAVRHLQSVEDRKRQGLRLAGDVGGKGDDGAELTKADRVAEYGRHQNAGGGKRQGDAGQAVEEPGAERTRGLLEPRVHRLQRQPHRAHHDRKTHHRAGERRTRFRKRKPDVKHAPQERARRPLNTENHQQQPARHDRWQRQRQKHQRIQYAPAWEAAACEKHRGRSGKRQPDTDRTRGHAERQQNRLAFFIGEDQCLRLRAFVNP